MHPLEVEGTTPLQLLGLRVSQAECGRAPHETPPSPAAGAKAGAATGAEAEAGAGAGAGEGAVAVSVSPPSG